MNAHALPFAALPHALVADAELKPRHVVLAAVLLRYARAKDHCWPSNRRLAADMGCTDRTVRNALAKLRARWVSVEHDADNRTGRRIVLNWRRAVSAPRKSGATARRAPISTECTSLENEEKKERPGLAPEGPPAGEGGGDPAATAEDLALWTTWAEGPNATLAKIGRAALATAGVVAPARAVAPLASLEPRGASPGDRAEDFPAGTPPTPREPACGPPEPTPCRPEAAAAEVVDNVRHGAQTIPANESQARPLAHLNPEPRRAAWALAVEAAPDGEPAAEEGAGRKPRVEADPGHSTLPLMAMSQGNPRRRNQGSITILKSGRGADYLTARIARDRPDILGRMKAWAAAARGWGVSRRSADPPPERPARPSRSP